MKPVRFLRWGLAILAALAVALSPVFSQKKTAEDDLADAVEALKQSKAKEARKEQKESERSETVRRAGRAAEPGFAELRSQVGDTDLYFRGGTAYRKEWAVRAGLTILNLPYYEGWADATDTKEAYERFSPQGQTGETLVSILVNRGFMDLTKAEFVNFFALVWVPGRFAYKLHNERSFEALKEKTRAEIVAARKKYVDREDFRSFDDYMNFKFGRDDEVEDIADGYWIEARDTPESLTYFYTSEFAVRTKKEDFRAPMIATSSLAVVRGKLIRADIKMVYRSRDDLSRLLEFTETLLEDIRRVNSADKGER